jgi:cGMP-dependent protein kinase
MWFFIIEKGLLQVSVQGKIKKQLRVGEGFGEIALLYKTPRAFSVQACEGCCLWGIDRNTFRRAVEEIILKEYEENKVFMENVRFFRALRNDHKEAVASSLVEQTFPKGQTLVQEGDPGSTFYVIKQGEASVWKGNELFTKLVRTDTFGEQSLLYNTVRLMSVKAETDLTCLILNRETLSRVLGDQIFIVTFRNFLKWVLEKSTYISKLTKE